MAQPTVQTLDQALAGMKPTQYIHKSATNSQVANKMYSLWTTNGIPGNGVIDLTTSGGVVLNSSSTLVHGQIPHYDPPAGKNSYLSAFGMKAAPATAFILADRLWHCGANTTGTLNVITTAFQTITSVAWPPRDNQGTANGYGVHIALEVTTTLGAGTPVFSANVTGANGITTNCNNIIATAASAVAGTFHPFGFGIGNTAPGVQSVQSFKTSTTATSGQYILVAYRPICFLMVPAAGMSRCLDVLTGGFPQIYNGSVPFLINYCQAAGQQNCHGYYGETQG